MYLYSIITNSGQNEEYEKMKQWEETVNGMLDLLSKGGKIISSQATANSVHYIIKTK